MNQEKELDRLISRTSIISHILMAFSGCAIGAALFLIIRAEWIIGYAAMFVVLHITRIFLLLKLKQDPSYVIHYYTLMVIFTFPAVLILWRIQVYLIILLYLLFPLVIAFHYRETKYAVYAVFFSSLLIVATIVISLKVQWVISASSDIVLHTNIFILLMAAVFLTLFVYLYYKILTLMSLQESTRTTVRQEDAIATQESATVIQECTTATQECTTVIQEAGNEQSEETYSKIVLYFEKKQPYLQLHYCLSMLAADLNVGKKYLSDAIRIHHHGTFDSLLNKYRLKYVKQMLDEGLAEKYTIEYIYTLAGYSSRTAFYENFQKEFKISPLDYQKLHKVKN